MILPIFLLFILVITLFIPIANNVYEYEGFSNQTRKQTYIDLIDEFKRLRYLLDEYDTEASENPYDCNLQKRRSTLEHLLTNIVIYVQEYGHKAPVDDVMKLMKSVNLKVQPQMLSPETIKSVSK
jgi:hypothetical protein